MATQRDLFAAIVIAGIAIGCGDGTETDAGPTPTDSGMTTADAGGAMDAGTDASVEDASVEDAGEDAMVAIL